MGSSDDPGGDTTVRERWDEAARAFASSHLRDVAVGAYGWEVGMSTYRTTGRL